MPRAVIASFARHRDGVAVSGGGYAVGESGLDREVTRHRRTHAPSDLQLGAIVQDEDPFPLWRTAQLADPGKVDQRRAMDAKEPGREPLLERADRLAQ